MGTEMGKARLPKKIWSLLFGDDDCECVITVEVVCVDSRCVRSPDILRTFILPTLSTLFPERSTLVF